MSRKPITKLDIIECASKSADARTVGKIRLVLGQFATAYDFLAAADSKGKLSSAYNAAKPDGRNGLGVRFYNAVSRTINELFSDKPHAPEQQPEDTQAKPGRFYSVQQLNALVSFMELCGVQAIDLAGVDAFSKVMRFDVFKAIGCDDNGGSK